MRRFVLATSVFLAMTAAASAQQAPAADTPEARGEGVFRQCRACHQVGPTARNAVGPQLNGLFGRKAGSVEGFRYSAAYQALDKVWSEENFRVYIQDPRGTTPGTSMAFAGIRNAAQPEVAQQQITDLIAYLKQFKADGSR